MYIVGTPTEIFSKGGTDITQVEKSILNLFLGRLGNYAEEGRIDRGKNTIPSVDDIF